MYCQPVTKCALIASLCLILRAAHAGFALEKANRLEILMLMVVFNETLSVMLVYTISVSQPVMGRSIPMSSPACPSVCIIWTETLAVCSSQVLRQKHWDRPKWFWRPSPKTRVASKCLCRLALGISIWLKEEARGLAFERHLHSKHIVFVGGYVYWTPCSTNSMWTIICNWSGSWPRQLIHVTSPTESPRAPVLLDKPLAGESLHQTSSKYPFKNDPQSSDELVMSAW